MYSVFVVAFTKKAKFKRYMPTKLYNFVWRERFLSQKSLSVGELQTAPFLFF